MFYSPMFWELTSSREKKWVASLSCSDDVIISSFWWLVELAAYVRDSRDPAGSTTDLASHVPQQHHTRTACCAKLFDDIRLEKDKTFSCYYGFGIRLWILQLQRIVFRPRFGLPQGRAKQENLKIGSGEIEVLLLLHLPVDQTNVYIISNPRGRVFQQGNDIADLASKEAARLFEGSSVSNVISPLI